MRLGPTTVVNREYDENGGVTKTVTTTTTEEREYKAGTHVSQLALRGCVNSSLRPKGAMEWHHET